MHFWDKNTCSLCITIFTHCWTLFVTILRTFAFYVHEGISLFTSPALSSLISLIAFSILELLIIPFVPFISLKVIIFLSFGGYPRNYSMPS